MKKTKNLDIIIPFIFIILFFTGSCLYSESSIPKEIPSTYATRFVKTKNGIYFSAGYCIYKVENSAEKYNQVYCHTGWETLDITDYGKNLLVFAKDMVEKENIFYLLAPSGNDISWKYSLSDPLLGQIGLIEDNLVYSDYDSLFIYNITSQTEVFNYENGGIFQFAIQGKKIYIANQSDANESLAILDTSPLFQNPQKQPVLSTSNLSFTVLLLLPSTSNDLLVLGRKEDGSQSIYSINPDLKRYNWVVDYEPDYIVSCWPSGINPGISYIIGEDEDVSWVEWIQFIDTTTGALSTNFNNLNALQHFSTQTNLQPDYYFAEKTIGWVDFGNPKNNWRKTKLNSEPDYIDVINFSETSLLYITDFEIGEISKKDGKIIWNKKIDSKVMVHNPAAD